MHSEQGFQPPRDRPIYLDTSFLPVFGVSHAPARDAASDTGVLICGPFGRDDVASYGTRRDWAQHLAGAGFETLRFDLPGTGDSAGAARDAGLVEAWVDSVSSCAAWLRGRAGIRRVAVIGMGLGGMLSVGAVVRGAAIDDLVLWAVPAHGRTLIHELRAVAKMLDAESSRRESAEESAERIAEVPAGALMVSGFLMSAETVGSLEALDLTATPPPDHAARRVLMLGRHEATVDMPLRAFFESSGAEVTVVRSSSYHAMVDHPQRRPSTIPELSAITSWLRNGASRPGETASIALDREELMLEVDGVSLRERPVDLDMPEGRLRAIIAEPVNRQSASLGAVLFNAGAIRRIGPNRMWVEISRRWAARGVPTVRIDLEGIGDSEGDPAPYEDNAGLYSERLAAQAGAAIERLGEHGFPDQAVAVGMCSGASWSFHAAARSERVVGAIMLNPRVIYWHPEIDAARDLRHVGQLISGRGVSWRKALRAFRVRRAVDAVQGTLTRLISFPRRAANRHAELARLDEAFDELHEKGKVMRFVFSQGEDLYVELDSERRWERYTRTPDVRVELIPDFDHDLRPLRAQVTAHQVVDAGLDAMLARVDGARPQQ